MQCQPGKAIISEGQTGKGERVASLLVCCCGIVGRAWGAGGRNGGQSGKGECCTSSLLLRPANFLPNKSDLQDHGCCSSVLKVHRP